MLPAPAIACPPARQRAPLLFWQVATTPFANLAMTVSAPNEGIGCPMPPCRIWGRTS